MRTLVEINLSSKDIMLIALFGALSVFPLLWTNAFNLVALTHIPGTNGIYVQFITALILWVGIGVVGKFGSTMAISVVSSIVGVIVPGDPGLAKPLLIPFNIVTGFIIDIIILKSKSGVLNRLIAGFFGILRGLHVVVVQTFFGIPIAVGLPVVAVVCISGAIGANVGIQLLKRLYSSGMIEFKRRHDVEFNVMLEKAISFHGHACVGLVLGTRIAIAALQRLGVNDPSETRDLIVYVEIDRCLADAIQAITGCTIGKRSLKHVDYGKFAATFVDISRNRAVRISVKEKARELAMKYCEERGRIVSRKKEMKIMAEAYSKIRDVDLLDVRNVSVSIPKWDLPGLPERKVACTVCGERIFDGREKIKDGRILCRPCAEGAYYRVLCETP